MVHAITFVIPTFNSISYIERTISQIKFSCSEANLVDYEIIVVDDGSTDKTSSLFANQKDPQLNYIFQKNAGRLKARERGISFAKYNNIILIDSRVVIDLNAIKFLLDYYSKAPLFSTYVSTVVFDSHDSLIGYFWDALARLAWWKYYVNPIDIEITSKNFDFVPKGTTMVASTKIVLEKTYAKINELVEIKSNTNDDTLLFRFMIDFSRVLICKDFICFYTPRKKFADFVQHVSHRGSVAKGGYFAPNTIGAKFLVFFLVYLFLNIVIAFNSVIWGFIIAILPFSSISLLSLKINGLRRTLSLVVYTPIFVPVYFLALSKSFIRKMADK